MSSAVTRSNSRVRSVTPESTIVPPCDKASFQQRIKSARNIEPKLSTWLKSKTISGFSCRRNGLRISSATCSSRPNSIVSSASRRRDDRQITVTFERERLISGRRILDGHRGELETLEQEFRAANSDRADSNHYSRAFRIRQTSPEPSRHAEGRQFENARTTS